MRCWIWYETRHFGIWGKPLWAPSSNAADLDYVREKHKARVSQERSVFLPVCEKEQGDGVSL